jgi:hypothetical protein
LRRVEGDKPAVLAFVYVQHASAPLAVAGER